MCEYILYLTPQSSNQADKPATVHTLVSQIREVEKKTAAGAVAATVRSEWTTLWRSMGMTEDGRLLRSNATILFTALQTLTKSTKCSQTVSYHIQVDSANFEERLFAFCDRDQLNSLSFSQFVLLMESFMVKVVNFSRIPKNSVPRFDYLIN